MERVTYAGLPADVYRSARGTDCTNGGVSSVAERVILVGAGIPEIFKAREDDVVLWVEPWYGAYKATPLQKLPPRHVGWMFGGNFAYSSDSRMPGNAPIPIHDRSELYTG